MSSVTSSERISPVAMRILFIFLQMIFPVAAAKQISPNGLIDYCLLLLCCYFSRPPIINIIGGSEMPTACHLSPRKFLISPILNPQIYKSIERRLCEICPAIPFPPNKPE
jgi:hypothetical protein